MPKGISSNKYLPQGTRNSVLRKRGLLPPITLYSLDEAIEISGIKDTNSPKEVEPMNKTLTIKAGEASDDSLPVYRGRECIGWIDRSTIKYYNVHNSLGQNVYCVGEADWSSEHIWIFDRTCFQWAEFTSIPSILSIE